MAETIRLEWDGNTWELPCKAGALAALIEGAVDGYTDYFEYVHEAVSEAGGKLLEVDEWTNKYWPLYCRGVPVKKEPERPPRDPNAPRTTMDDIHGAMKESMGPAMDATMPESDPFWNAWR